MDPILRDFRYRFDTERLTIRGPLPGDGATVRTAVVESQAALKEWMPWAVTIPTVAEYEAMMRKKQLQFLAREDLQLLLFLKDTTTLIGSSGLHRIDWNVPKFEIGYWVRTAYAGNGYITEAVKGIAHFAQTELGARRLEIRCDARNERSTAVARRAGFTHEATLRHDERHHLTGQLRDTLIFVQLTPDP